MTEENQEADDTADESPLNSYTVSIQKEYEMDLDTKTAMALVAEADTTNPEEAIASTIATQEMGQIEPTQKLLGIDVQVDGPSND